MISLRKYLEAAGAEEARQVFCRVTGLILEGVAIHAVSCGNTELEIFQSTIRRLASALEGADSAGLLLIAGSVIQAIQEYNDGVGRRFTAQVRELHGIIGLLTAALSASLHGNERAVHNLRGIERRLEGASRVEDLRTVKMFLEECLASVQAEAAAQSARSESSRQVLNAAKASPPVLRAMEEAGADPCTGLPARSQAGAALAAAAASGAPKYAAVLHLGRLAAIRTRYGQEVADTAVLVVCQHIAQRLQPRDEMFRWSDQSFLVILERQVPADAVRAEVSRWSAAHLECTVEVEHRTVLLALSLSSLVLPLWESEGAGSLEARIDAFARGSLPCGT